MRVRFQDSLVPLCDRSRKVFQLAHQEAHRLNHPAVGIEHLLLGLAKEGQSPPAIELRSVGFDLAWLREQVKQLRPAGPTDLVLPPALPYSKGLDSFLEGVLVAGEACELLPLTPEFLLAALLDQPDGPAIQVLRKRRLSLWWLRRRVRRLCRSCRGK